MLTLLVSTNACNRNCRCFWFTKLDPNRINSGMKLLFDAPKLIAHSKNSWNAGSATKVGILSWRRILMNSKSMVFELSALLCNAHSPDNTDKAVNSVVRKAIELLSFNAFEMRAQAPGSSTTNFQDKTSTNKPSLQVLCNSWRFLTATAASTSNRPSVPVAKTWRSSSVSFHSAPFNQDSSTKSKWL